MADHVRLPPLTVVALGGNALLRRGEPATASALLAVGLSADVLALATDVDAVYTGWGTQSLRAVGATTPAWLRAQSFAAGSMGPKVEAVCRFVEATGKRAAIGRLEDLPGLVDGTAGTQIRADDSDPGNRKAAVQQGEQ